MTSSSINMSSSTDEEALNASTECFLPSTVETIPSETLRYCILLWYIATAVLALTGNVIVMIVQMYGLRSKGGIRKYLINLAISDIVSGVICVPFTYLNTVLGHWSFPLWLCPAGQFLQLLSVFVTSTTLSVIAIERYTVTLHPHCQLARWLKASKTVTLVVVWLLGVAYASPLLAHTGVVQFEMHHTLYYECKFDIGLSDSKRHIFIVANLCLTFILPLLLMIGTYSAIMLKVYHRNSIPVKIQTHHCLLCKRQITHLCAVKSGEKCSQSVCCSQPCQQRIQRKGAKRYKLTRHCSLDNRYRIISMMLAVILLYCLSWCPIKSLQFLLLNDLIASCTEWEYYRLIALYISAHWLTTASGLINPIVYSLMSDNFKVSQQESFTVLTHDSPTGDVTRSAVLTR